VAERAEWMLGRPRIRLAWIDDCGGREAADGLLLDSHRDAELRECMLQPA